MKKMQDGSTELPRHRRHWRNYTLWPYLERLKRSDAPILVGPWRGEVGFEVLYWIPFIDQIAHMTGIPRERFVPISRGGASAWYGTPTGLELYAFRSPQQVRVANREQVAETGLFKQETVSPFDRGIIYDAADQLKVSKYHVLHPAWMYLRLAEYWTMHKGLSWLNPQLRYTQIQTPAVNPSVNLPKDFVAVRFYSRATMPGRHKQVMGFLKGCIDTIQQDHEVVILDSDLSLDDHMDMTHELTGPRVHHLSEYGPLHVETNLATMSAILGRARGFVGTYGGFAQLALRCGVPSVSFYAEWEKTSIAHALLAHTLSVRSGVPSYVLRIGDLPMLTAVLPEVRVEAPVSSPLAFQTA